MRGTSSLENEPRTESAPNTVQPPSLNILIKVSFNLLLPTCCVRLLYLGYSMFGVPWFGVSMKPSVYEMCMLWGSLWKALMSVRSPPMLFTVYLSGSPTKPG